MARLQREYPGRGDGSAEDIAEALDSLTDHLPGAGSGEQI